MEFSIFLGLPGNKCCPQWNVKYRAGKEQYRARRKGFPNSLIKEEKNLISRVKEIYRSKTRVYCTGYHYCMNALPIRSKHSRELQIPEQCRDV